MPATSKEKSRVREPILRHITGSCMAFQPRRQPIQLSTDQLNHRFYERISIRPVARCCTGPATWNDRPRIARPPLWGYVQIGGDLRSRSVISKQPACRTRPLRARGGPAGSGSAFTASGRQLTRLTTRLSKTDEGVRHLARGWPTPGWKTATRSPTCARQCDGYLFPRLARHEEADAISAPDVFDWPTTGDKWSDCKTAELTSSAHGYGGLLLTAATEHPTAKTA